MKKINTFLQYLTNIEHVFNEDLYVEAEEMLDNNKISILNSEKHVFNLKYSGRPSQKIIIQLSSEKLSNHECSCSGYKNKSICSHIVTAYLLIRKNLLLIDDDPPITSSKTRQKNKPIRDILSKTSQEDLISFIANIAKKDKKLSTAIRVHFLSQGKRVDASSIKQILDSIISPIRNTDKKVSRTDWLLLFRTLEDFKGQTKDAITLSKFDLAYGFIESILNKLYYCLTKFETKEQELKKLIEEYTELCHEFFTKLEAPLSKERYAKLLVKTIEKSYYKPLLAFDFLHVILNQELLEQSMKNKLAEQISKKLLESEKEQIHSLSLQLRLIISNKSSSSDLLKKINRPLEQAVIKEIQEEKDDYCLHQLIDHHQDDLDTINLHELIVDLNLKEQNYEKVSQSLLLLLKASNQITYYRQLKALYPTHINLASIEIAKGIISDWSAVKLLEFYLIEADYSRLCLSLAELNDIHLCFEYDVQIPTEHEELVAMMYTSILNKYLEQHIGVNTNTYISKILNHVRNLESNYVYSVIRSYLNSNYYERKSVKSLLDTYR